MDSNYRNVIGVQEGAVRIKPGNIKSRKACNPDMFCSSHPMVNDWYVNCLYVSCGLIFSLLILYWDGIRVV